MSKKIVNVFTLGEGYITFLLLRSLSIDGVIEGCFQYFDKPIFPPDTVNLVVLKNLDDTLLEIFKHHPHRDKLVVISENCKGLENCIETQKGVPFFYAALLEIARVLGEEKLYQLVKDSRLTHPEINEEFEFLIEKLLFYIPVLIGKRESIIYAWKYFLGKVNQGAITYIYPRDGEIIESIFNNILFADKIVAIPLGILPKDLIERIKLKGFVPYGVQIEGKNNLDSELQLINYGRVVAEKLKERQF